MASLEVGRAMPDLLTLVGRDTRLKRVAGTNGGEWAGPCPWCGGTDRFRVWPEPRDGKPDYWCRQCGRKGDAVQYLRDRDGLTFAEAKDRLGLPSERQQRPTTPRPRVDPEPAPPGVEWQAAARQVVSACASALWADGGAVALGYLRGRGLDDDTIWRARLGWNPERRDLHGLWVERGITVPWYMDADLWAVNVRCFDAGGNPEKQSGRKYRALAGGLKAIPYGVGSLAGKAVAVVVESELDALLVTQEAGDLVGAVALGSAKGLPSAGLAHLLPCRRLLVGGDEDAAGASMAAKWRAFSPRVRSVHVPQGKDVTEFWQAGGRVRDWVLFEMARLEHEEPVRGQA